MPLPTTYVPVVSATNGDYRATALVGSHSVILGWNATNSVRDGLLGFAVRRTDLDPETEEVQRVQWLSGQKRFPGLDDDLGIDVRSDQAPFQRFRWSDYTVTAERVYRYEIFPMRGSPGALERDPGLVLEVRPSPDEQDGVGIYVNRGVTAAHAYLKRFGVQVPDAVPDGRALRWLSRGLKESLLIFIERAGAGDELFVAIYEFHDVDVARSLAAASGRGVGVRIVFHAPDEDQKAVQENRHLLNQAGLSGLATARTHTKISHNKFVVLVHDRTPTSLWTGSANFSHNAFNLQTNAAMTFEGTQLAGLYLTYWEVLAGDPERGRRGDGGQTGPEQIEAIMTGGSPGDVADQVLFSPVRRNHILDVAVDLIANAQSAVMVSAPFALDKSVKDALAANDDDILEYGLSNSVAKKSIAGLGRKNTRFFTPSKLKTYAGKAWDSKSFGAHKIHAKTIIADPWSPRPRVLFGSANFSDESCRSNDENALLIEGNPRIAAVLTTEFMRMFDHYKSRHFINQAFQGVASLDLTTDESWSRTAFDATSNSHKFRDREVFSPDI